MVGVIFVFLLKTFLLLFPFIALLIAIFLLATVIASLFSLLRGNHAPANLLPRICSC